jgi:hypothetical protein
MRVLYVYKFNPHDTNEIALRLWLERVFENVSLFAFLPEEKKRTSEEKGSSPCERLLTQAREFQPTHVISWVPYLNLPEVQALKSLGAKVTAAVNGVSSLSTGLFSSQAR